MTNQTPVLKQNDVKNEPQIEKAVERLETLLSAYIEKAPLLRRRFD